LLSQGYGIPKPNGKLGEYENGCESETFLKKAARKPESLYSALA